MSMLMRIEMSDHDARQIESCGFARRPRLRFHRGAKRPNRASAPNLPIPPRKCDIRGRLQKTSHLARFKHGSAIDQDNVASHAESRPVLRQRNCFLEGVSVGH